MSTKKVAEARQAVHEHQKTGDRMVPEWVLEVCDEADRIASELDTERRAHSETLAAKNRLDEGWQRRVDKERAAHAETRAELTSARVCDYWKKRMAECGVCTPAERKVLEAWGAAPEVALRAVSSMPKHLFGWLLPACEAELAKRGV